MAFDGIKTLLAGARVSAARITSYSCLPPCCCSLPPTPSPGANVAALPPQPLDTPFPRPLTFSPSPSPHQDDSHILELLAAALKAGPDPHLLSLDHCTGCKQCGEGRDWVGGLGGAARCGREMRDEWVLCL